MAGSFWLDVGDRKTSFFPLQEPGGMEGGRGFRSFGGLQRARSLDLQPVPHGPAWASFLGPCLARSSDVRVENRSKFAADKLQGAL